MNEAQLTELLLWSEDHMKCAICWWPSTDMRRGMEVHHIVGGANRSKGHVVENYLKLCDRCHMVYHGGKVVANVPDLHLGHILDAKRESDPDNFDTEKLAAIKNRKALHWEPEPVPNHYKHERIRNLRGYEDRNP